LVRRTNLFYLFSEITEIVKLLVFLKKIGNNRRIRTNFLNSFINQIIMLCLSYLRIQSDESFAKAEVTFFLGALWSKNRSRYQI
jgi:hypothetical protein